MVTIRDEHLERLLDAERVRRGDATMAKTLGDLAREKLTELRMHGDDADSPDDAAAAPDREGKSPRNSSKEAAAK